MPVPIYRLNTHTRRRMQHRNVTPDEIQLALEHGQIEYRAGTKFYFLGRRDIPAKLRRTHSRFKLSLITRHINLTKTFR